MLITRNVQARALEGKAARFWYQRAHYTVQALASETDKSLEEVAATLAVTSPGITVDQNVRVTRAILTGGPLVHPYGRNIQRALDHYHATGKIRGPKTSAFHRNLLGNLEPITLDRWMARVLHADERWPAKQRRAAIKRVKRVSEGLGWQPAEVQAALWHTAMVQANYADPHDVTWM